MEPKTPKVQLALSAELRNVIHERNILTNRTKKMFISALNEVHNSEIEEKRETRKNQAVQEILNSEAAYLKQLENIMIFFMKPIKEKGVIKEDDFDVLFGSIDNIYKVNGELLNLLKEDLTNVALAFSKLAPFFKMYSVYAYDFKKSLLLLENLLKSNEAFATLICNQESRPEVQAKLSSLLITPIQRIPRYCLLLKQVLGDTLTTDSDYNSLKDSLEKLQSVAEHLNFLVEERENSQRLLELQRCLKDGSSLVVQPGRKLIMQGELNRVKSNLNKDKVHLILFSDIIMLCKQRKKYLTNNSYLKCSFIYPLNRCKIQQNVNTKIFEIHCQNEAVILYHDSGNESDKWIKIIKESIESCVKNRSTLRKGSSSRRPADKNNLKPYMDAGVSPGIARLKKRRRSELMNESEDNNENYERSPKLVKINKEKHSKIFRGKPLQRKALCLNTTSREEGIVKEEMTDSLFPLRQHFIRENPGTDLKIYQPNLFVFGQNNENRGFGFKLGNVISGIGNKIKKIFGMK